MTLGEKIKEARKNMGLTQEQMAEKLMVSRPAVAKWESDKGTPDIDNLKAISKLLNVSIDYLVDDGSAVDMNLMREPIDLSQWGKGRKKVKKDKIVRSKFPQADITTLVASKVETKAEKITDNVLGFVFDAPFGVPQFLNQIKMLDSEFYLVEQDSAQYLIRITDEFMETRRIHEKIETQRGKRFQIGELIYTNAGPILYAPKEE